MSDVLDFFYNNASLSKNIVPRKTMLCNLDADKIQLIGSPKCGKTALLHELMSALPKKNTLLIDLNDARMSVEEQELKDFCKQKKIENLIVDNYYYNFELPNIKKTVITSEYDVPMQGFDKHRLHGLDFEEFIAFQKNPSNTSHIFSTYLKDGVLPEVTTLHESHKINRLQEIPKLIFNTVQEEDIFRFLFHFLGSDVSVHQLFSLYKREEKISKDRFYEIFKNFKERGLIHLLPKLGRKAQGGKLYFFDYGLVGANLLQKDFLKNIQNLVFLELLKRDSDLSFDERFDFRNETSDYLCIPFTTHEALRKKLEKFKPDNTQRLMVLTMGYKEKLSDNIEALPLWEWLV